MVPFWGRFTTHFRTYFSGWIESDVHWGLTDLDFDPWPYPAGIHMIFGGQPQDPWPENEERKNRRLGYKNGRMVRAAVNIHVCLNIGEPPKRVASFRFP